jgi:predicted transcriptional regulator
MEIKTIKKTQKEATLEMDHLGKRTGATDANITNRIKEIEERILGIEDTIEYIDTSDKGNTKCKKLLTQNIQEIQDTMKRSNL